MNYSRAAWVGLAIAGSIAGAVVIDHLRRNRRSSIGRSKEDVEWDLADDFTQAVANALPHESGAFNVPPRDSQS